MVRPSWQKNGGVGYPRGGGRQQLSGGPSLLTSTPVSCRWGQGGEEGGVKRVIEKNCTRQGVFCVRNIGTWIISDCCNICAFSFDFINCAQQNSSLVSTILKLRVFIYNLIPQIDLEDISGKCWSTWAFLKAFGHKMSPSFSTIVSVLSWKGWA